jgi:hypothetical protein
MRGPLSPRMTVAIVIVLLLSPTLFAGGSYYARSTETPDRPDAPFDPANLTIVSTQGTHFHGEGLNPGSGQVVGVRDDNATVVWTHDRFGWYYDIDPITNRTLLVVGADEVDGEYVRVAVEWNWVTNETSRRFRLPGDTHDVDRLGPHRYAIADKVTHRAFVYNFTADRDEKHATDAIIWEFRFHEHFSEPPVDGHEGDYTHLNDIDVIDGGDAFMLSPRNFNRVIAVNRSTREVQWELGEQFNRTILDGQHHPVVIESDPLTVLIGDSENNRVVEYQRVGEDWKLTWSYAEGLNWPRGVQRLPNGNTMIADTGNDRIIEVTPNGSVVWEYETKDPHPYDGYRLPYGDDHRGPTMAELRDDDTSVQAANGSTSISMLEYTHRLAGWILPIWIGKWEFLSLVAATILTVGWVGTELALAIRRRL